MPGFAQVETEGNDANGFTRIDGKYVDIITDLPADEELKSLPLVFEKAMPIWCEIFGVEFSEVAEWHTEAFIMLDKARFDRAGLIPPEVPDFPHGFQYGNQMWVVEQPSVYYRRHLLLHEGTHWFMNRYFGSSGPPWLMEGMAEWLGTHQWDAAEQVLKMGIIPSKNTEVPYWGRVKRIQDQLDAQEAPSLESILRYGSTAHRSVDAYAWSWAAVVFLQNHPDTTEAFQELLQQPMQSDGQMSRWLFERCRARWPAIRGQWRSFATDLKYDYQPELGLLRMSEALAPVDRSGTKISILTNQPWQSSGLYVRQNQRVSVTATGRYSIAQEPSSWECEPEGVTLEYYAGSPVGKLMLRIVSLERVEASRTVKVETIPVGSEFTWTAQSDGELHFQVNEPNQALGDNRGSVSVTVGLAK